MNIRDFSSDFLISIFSQDPELGSDIKLSLSAAKYEATYFADHSELLLRSEISPAHCIVIDIETLIVPVHEFMEAVLKISAEVQFIILAGARDVTAFKKYKKYNLAFVTDREAVGISEIVLLAIDLVCEKLYRIFQNEQIFAAYQNEKDLLDRLQEKNKDEIESVRVRPYQNRISIYKLAESKEQLLDLFYQATPAQSWLYLKFVSSIQTFICVSATNSPESWSEGLSYKIPQKDKNFADQILSGFLPDSFCEYLKNKFGVHRIKFLPLIIKQNVEGILISTQDIAADVAEDFSLMSLVYTNLVYESQPKFLDVEDSLTGFYNELFYKRILDKEIDRSKRTYLPLSVIKIKIDKFLEIEASHGQAVADEIIKKVAEQIKSTSRLPVYICRTAENEFSIVLINCHRKGAALRAERLRQSLQAEKFTKSGLQITVSQGISEYPTLTGTIDELNLSAASALKFISEKGGNKICIYKAPSNHHPDFTVNV